MAPLFFATPARWRQWLARHAGREPEVWVGFHKVSTGKPSITWAEAVDEALAVGWIDGVRRSIDAASYMIRFSPRRPGSKWSAINVRRIEALTREGRIRPAGVVAFEARQGRPAGYSYEERDRASLIPDQERLFRKHRKAWSQFQALPPGDRRTAVWWVVSAKKEATRERRLKALIDASARGERIAPLARANPARGAR